MEAEKAVLGEAVISFDAGGGFPEFDPEVVACVGRITRQMWSGAGGTVRNALVKSALSDALEKELAAFGGGGSAADAAELAKLRGKFGPGGSDLPHLPGMQLSPFAGAGGGAMGTVGAPAVVAVGGGGSAGDDVTRASAAAQQALSQAKQTLAVAAALADALDRELGSGGATVQGLRAQTEQSVAAAGSAMQLAISVPPPDAALVSSGGGGGAADALAAYKAAAATQAWAASVNDAAGQYASALLASVPRRQTILQFRIAKKRLLEGALARLPACRA
ncbi:hypothetical protein FOA52_005593 [Chlamydomonas sp. UWO 241]|nr:hypothetical protein FOA52_005593 [Chlamydomonas sp. UWO 241]